MGLILGTGTNLAADLGPAGIRNLESGNFDGVAAVETPYDAALDRELDEPAPGAQRFEKMVSGHYLGEILRRATAGGAGAAPSALATPFALDSADLSRIAADHTRGLDDVDALLRALGVPSTVEERRDVRALGAAIARRAARLVGAALVGTLRFLDAELADRRTIAVDGSLWGGYPGFEALVRESIVELVGGERAGADRDRVREGFHQRRRGGHRGRGGHAKERVMQLGMIGLGRMGANMVRRLSRAGHDCVVYDVSAPAVQALAREGATGAASLQAFVQALARPRTVWIMVPAAVVDQTLDSLAPLLERDDVIIDGGNSHYHDDIRRAGELGARGLHYVDVGTSGGVWGLERGFCLMIGGEAAVVKRLDPIFASLAPGLGDIPRTPGREKIGGTAEHGYLHCGPNGAGHFVKMVHNGIEYGLMAAYAEGLNILRHANVGRAGDGARRGRRDDAAPRPRSTTSTIWTCATSPRSGGAAAWSPRGCSISPRARSPGAGTSAASRAGSPIRGRGAGPSRPPSTRACRCRC